MPSALLWMMHEKNLDFILSVFLIFKQLNSFLVQEIM